MAEDKKQDVRMIFKIIAFLAFIMLGYLGIRNYKLSVEKLKINQCTDEIIELVHNIHDIYRNQMDYGEFDYKVADKMKVYPKKMMRQGIREATNAYLGGVDVYYSSTYPDKNKSAFEVSFQGLSKMGCMALFRLGELEDLGLIAVAAYSNPTPSGVLDEIYLDTKQTDIKKNNIFIAKGARYVADDRAEKICNCKEDVCTVVWKFK